MDDATRKTLLFASGGLNEDMMKRPKQVTETSGEHRALQDIVCHDCGRLISAGEYYVSSTVNMVEGMKGQSGTFAIHTECYKMLAHLMRHLDITRAHTFGIVRPPMWQLYKDAREHIKTAHPELAAIFEMAFEEQLK